MASRLKPCPYMERKLLEGSWSKSSSLSTVVWCGVCYFLTCSASCDRYRLLSCPSNGRFSCRLRPPRGGLFLFGASRPRLNRCGVLHWVLRIVKSLVQVRR